MNEHRGGEFSGVQALSGLREIVREYKFERNNHYYLI